VPEGDPFQADPAPGGTDDGDRHRPFSGPWAAVAIAVMVVAAALMVLVVLALLYAVATFANP